MVYGKGRGGGEGGGGGGGESVPTTFFVNELLSAQIKTREVIAVRLW